MYESIVLNIDLKSTSSSQQHVTTSSTQFGFVIAGYCPCYVANVLEDSVSDRAGLRRGDLIMSINGVNCCRARIKTLLSLIKGQTSLKLAIHRRRGSSHHVSKSIKSNKSTTPKPACKLSTWKRLLKKPSTWFCGSQGTGVNVTQLQDVTAFYSRDEDQTGDSVAIEKGITGAKSVSTADTGYETLSRFDSGSTETKTDITVSDTLNSYSGCDLTTSSKSERKRRHNASGNKSISTKKRVLEHNDQQRFDKVRTKLIGDLIELEANFVSQLTMAVATFSRPLRGFFMRQQDYFMLFQNVEKIWIISENFLRSMDKWSAYDLYTKLGYLYSQKIGLFREAFTIYAQGFSAAKSLYNDLTAHSKQFRLFLKEVQSPDMTLRSFLDAPLLHCYRTLDLLKQIRQYTRDAEQAAHIESVMADLRQILSNLNTADNMNLVSGVNEQDMTNYDDTMTTMSTEEACSTFFMNENGSVMSTINENEDWIDCEEEENNHDDESPTVNVNDSTTLMLSKHYYDMTSCCSDGDDSSKSSTTSSSSLSSLKQQEQQDEQSEFYDF